MRGTTRRTVGIVAALCVVAIAFGALALHSRGNRSAPLPAAVGTEAIVARPAPADPPTPVFATGACARAMDAVRAIQHRFASGSLLTETGNRELTVGLARLDRDCDPQSAQDFRTQEVTPWLTYLPPSAG